MQSVDLRRLQVLRMVHAHGSVTAAAGALHLTPSAVSHQLRQLARELGTELLAKDGRGVRLTDAGRLLVRHADRLNEAWEQARADVAAHDEHITGTLDMAAFATALGRLLAPAAAELATTAPQLEVRLHEIDQSADGFELLLANEVDLALVSPSTEGPPLDDPRFDQQALLSEPLDLLVPADHRLADEEVVSLDAVACESWILADEASWDCHQLVASACAAAGFSPNIVHRAKTPVAVGALVAHHLGVAVVPRLLPHAPEAALARLPLAGDPPPTRSILTAVRRGSARQPALAHGLAAIRRAAGTTLAAIPAPA
jgi:DNA-binding transcriptional LysR family regulator